MSTTAVNFLFDKQKNWSFKTYCVMVKDNNIVSAGIESIIDIMKEFEKYYSENKTPS